jgi:hypothetical protein
MAIRTGIGVGAAQIADTSGIMNTYAKQVAQEQKAQALQAEKQAKENAVYNEQLADLLSGVKTDGARDVDIPDITKSYNELKEMYRQGLSIKDPAERALYRANLNKGVSSLNEYAQRSKKFAGDLFGVSQDIAKNEWDYDPNSVSYLSTLKRTSLKDLGANAVIDPMQFKRMPNVGIIEKILKDTYDLGEKKAELTNRVNKLGQKINIFTVEPEVIQNNLVQSIQNDPEAYSAVKSLYARTTGDRDITGEKLTNFIKELYETKYNYEYKGAPKDPRKSGGASGDGSGAGGKTEELYSALVNRGSTGDGEAWRELNALGGGNYTIYNDLKDSSVIKIKPAKTININEDGVSFKLETNGAPISIPKNNPQKLFEVLQKFGVRPSGVKSSSRLNKPSGGGVKQAPKKELTWAEKQAAKNKK